jgi:ferredoxin-fold anticodon binding domain-containing protein
MLTDPFVYIPPSSEWQYNGNDSCIMQVIILTFSIINKTKLSSWRRKDLHYKIFQMVLLKKQSMSTDPLVYIPPSSEWQYNGNDSCIMQVIILTLSIINKTKLSSWRRKDLHYKIFQMVLLKKQSMLTDPLV